jgi:hypothetical protein
MQRSSSTRLPAHFWSRQKVWSRYGREVAFSDISELCKYLILKKMVK